MPCADPVTIDLSRVERIDTVGAWLIHRTVRDRQAQGHRRQPEVAKLLDQVADADHPAEVQPEGPKSARRGRRTWRLGRSQFGRTFAGLLGFFGATLIGLRRRHHAAPSAFASMRVVQRFDVVGVRALGIIGLMSFLIGIVIGQQGAVQLQQFGAEIYTINLIGRITVRELAR